MKILYIITILITGFIFAGCDRCTPGSLPSTLPKFLEVCQEKLDLWGIDIQMNEEKNAVFANDQWHELKNYRSRFAADLTIEIKDDERSQIILNSYFSHIEPLIKNESIKESLEKWLYNNHRVFGAPDIDYHRLLIIEPKMQVFNQQTAMKNAFKKFTDEIDDNFRNKFQSSKAAPKNPSAVAIISGPYGGGHLSVADEISETLKESNDFTVQKIDECKDFQDPLAIATKNGKTQFRACTAFNDFTRLKNDPDKTVIVQHLNWLLSFYITPNQRKDLRQALEKGGFSLLVLTVHHVFDINSMPYTLKIPSLVSITDFDHPQGQWFDFNIMDPRYTRYLVPRNDKLYFRRMFLSPEADKLILHERSKLLMTELFEDPASNPSLTPLLPRLEVINILGYPVNPVITHPKNSDEILGARKALNLNTDPNRKIVTLSFGGAANEPKLKELMNNLIASRDALNHKIQLVLLSAGNEKLIASAKDIFNLHGIKFAGVESFYNSADPILGSIVEEKKGPHGMSNVYKASDVVLSKAGGATTAELCQSSTYYLRVFGLEEWEMENAIYLERLNLSVRTPASLVDSLNVDYSPYYHDLSREDIVEKLNEILSKPRQMSETKDYLTFERTELVDIVKKTIDKFKANPGF